MASAPLIVLTRHQTPILLVVLLAAIAGAARLLGLPDLNIVLTEMFIRVVVVCGLYVFIGNSGLISFGQIGFMCIGAYAAAWAAADPNFKQIMLAGLPNFLQTTQYSFAVAMLGAVCLPAIVALPVGLTIMRLSGTAASIATFAFLVIVNSVYSNWDSVTAGVGSIIAIPTPVGQGTACIFAGVGVAVAYAFQISRVGLLLRASREDSVAARASGIDIEKMRLGAYVLSAMLVGTGGGLYAQFLGILTVNTFYLNLSFITIAMLVVGGMSSLSGAVAGVVVVTAIIQMLRLLEQGGKWGEATVGLPQGSQEIGLGMLMAAILVFRPNGLMGGKELSLFRSPFRKASAEAMD